MERKQMSEISNFLNDCETIQDFEMANDNNLLKEKLEVVNNEYNF